EPPEDGDNQLDEPLSAHRYRLRHVPRLPSGVSLLSKRETSSDDRRQQEQSHQHCFHEPEERPIRVTQVGVERNKPFCGPQSNSTKNKQERDQPERSKQPQFLSDQIE